MRPQWHVQARGRRLWRRTLELAFDGCALSRRFRQAAMRKLFAEHCAPGTLAYVEFADHCLFVDPRDDKIAFRLLRGRPWQKDILEVAVKILQQAGALAPGGWFVDVGANIGTHTVYALRSGVFARALAVEAEAGNFRLLQRNAAANALDARVRLVHAAASRSRGQVLLTLNRKNLGGHSLEPGWIKSPSPAVMVQALPLDDIMAAEGLAVAEAGLVWIDVEGHEPAVLQGMARLRAAGVPIVFEHGGADGSGRLAEIKELLAPDYRFAVNLEDAVQRDGREDLGGLAVPLTELRLEGRPGDVLAFNVRA